MKEVLETVSDNPIILILVALIGGLIATFGCSILQDLVNVMNSC